jgi:hypothetical protein
VIIVVNIINEVDTTMKEEGVIKAAEKLEELVGLPIPEGCCLCRAEDGHVTFIGDTAKDKDKLEVFLDKWDEESDEIAGAYGMTYQMAKATCTGDFVKKE